MPDSVELKGRCLCGTVEVTAQAKTELNVCHCSMCRRWGGGPLMAASCGTGVVFQGQDAISVFDSSNWAQRGFCRRCGTHLFYRLKGSEEYFIPVGLFAEDPGFKMVQQIFIDIKPEFYEFANLTQNLTEAEVFAKFAQKS